MQLEKAARSQSKIKVGISGPSGSGKTYSALLLAYGLTDDWGKVAVVDSENRSASLFEHLGPFNAVNLYPPFTPESYVEAINLCERSGIEAIIVDSITHEWSGKGGCLEIHDRELARMKVPNSFAAWAPVTPRHQAFVDAIVQSHSHIICCIRSKTEYILVERNGKQVPQKVGMSPITRDGFEFEVSIHFELDQEHRAFSSKDRTSLFMDKDPFVITPNTGRLLRDWCMGGSPATEDYVTGRINGCKSLNELLQVYRHYPQYHKTLLPAFEQRKKQIILTAKSDTPLVNQQTIQDGTH